MGFNQNPTLVIPVKLMSIVKCTPQFGTNILNLVLNFKASKNNYNHIKFDDSNLTLSMINMPFNFSLH